eukprot:m.306684 g.306684  ORF g.306684 m.306684 type:complete len:159 (+) comp41496_c0_seq1:718-1194(+)
MYCVLVLSLLLTLARGESANLEGYWQNELGSCMYIDKVDGEGQFSGTYNSEDGNAKFEYDLIGRWDSSTEPSTEKGATLGWTVTWDNADYGNSESTTTWSGIYFPESGQEEQIQTTWLLTVSKAFSNVWESTLVGKDVFKRGECTVASKTLQEIGRVL